MTFSFVSGNNNPIHDARQLLQIHHIRGRRPTKDEIQKAFLESANLYHPDRKHHPDAKPCPAQFRQCVQARDLLLHHYSHSNHGYTSSLYYGRSNADRTSTNRTRSRPFAHGFPFRTLQVLTLQQKLAVRGTIMMLISLGASYDVWVRRENHQRRSTNHVDE